MWERDQKTDSRSRWQIRSCSFRNGRRSSCWHRWYGAERNHQKLLDSIKRSGYVRVQIDGSVYELTEEISLDKNKKHNIELVVDRLVVKEGIEKRLVDSIENVLELADGLMTVDVIGGEQIQFSQSFPVQIRYRR